LKFRHFEEKDQDYRFGAILFGRSALGFSKYFWRVPASMDSFNASRPDSPSARIYENGYLQDKIHETSYEVILVHV
jgi:hypothetical protein